MFDSSKELSQVADSLAVCVALIGLDDRGAPSVIACNDRFLQLSGAAGMDALTFPIALDALIADSAPSGFGEKLRACMASGGPQAPQRTYDFREGERWWRFSFDSIGHAGGDAGARRVIATGFDMAAQMEQATKREANASRYRALVDLAYDAIVAMDGRHNITLFNRAAENLFGYSSAEVLGKPIVILLPEKFRADHPRKVREFADSYQPSQRHATAPSMDESNSVYGQHRDGSIIPVEVAISKIDLDGGTEFMAVVRDISDRARLMELLRKQASTDALTGLPNRREFLDFIKKELAGGAGDLSVFILDIDFFKAINDQHGHDAGDEVLCVLAKVGASMMDGKNLFARWGGEEFVAALPGADAKLAYEIADELRRRYERQDFEHAWRAGPIPFTVSIGVVAREAGETDVDALMKRADRALYRAKKSGRNRVEPG